MAVALTPTDTQPSEPVELDLPPVWVAATKVVLMVAVLTGLVLALPAAGILALQSLLS